MSQYYSFKIENAPPSFCRNYRQLRAVNLMSPEHYEQATDSSAKHLQPELDSTSAAAPQLQSRCAGKGFVPLRFPPELRAARSLLCVFAPHPDWFVKAPSQFLCPETHA